MKKQVSVLFFGAIVACSVWSCKKKSSSPQTCNITGITDSSSTGIVIGTMTYDNSNRITSYNNAGRQMIFTYSGSSIFISATDTSSMVLNQYPEHDTITLNSAGMVQNDLRHYNDGSWINFMYEYNSSGLYAHLVESFTGGVADTNSFTFVNGNLSTAYYEQGNIDHPLDSYQYSSQALIAGDPSVFSQLLQYGAYVYTNKDLVSEVDNASGPVNTFQYTISNGKIEKIHQTEFVQTSATTFDTVIHTVSYTYTCK